ncbi:S-adenosyl-L-methionine-dependent methyltransferase [Kalaharituber pfeilii]|nr:S-adenosyl-L-methionine-dependent methyltransferase [Kalaharituber pfeilii]
MDNKSTPAPPSSPKAPKQRSEILVNPTRGAIPYTINIRFGNILRAVILLIAAAVGSYASQLTLGPVYGDIPTSLHHQKICASIFALVWGSKWIFRRIMRRPLLLLAVLAFYVPVLQRTLFQYSEKWGAEYGPLYTEAASYYPTLFLAVLASSELLEMPSFVLDIIPAVASFAIFNGVRGELPGFLAHRIGASWIYTRCGLAHLAAGLYTLVSPLTALLLVIPGLIHSGYYNPGCTDAAAARYLNASVASANYTVLARSESITGYVSVMENSFLKYRVMRCDHSLLGGEWQIPPPGHEHLTTFIKEPVYPVFVILEAVRLVRPGPAAKKPKALMIGLGIGTSQNGMIRHGVETHIVELDPAVYKYAQEYFGLLPNHTAHIMDAVKFVKGAVMAGDPVKYDFIVHDVFTGGAAPSFLFTEDMVNDMHKLLADDGVIAINYAGDLKQKPAKMVIETARSVFGHCKIFREDYLEDLNKAVDFTNMVIFCHKPSTPFRFRGPLEEDFLGSVSRKQFLYPSIEVSLDYLFGKDSNGELLHEKTLNKDTIKEFDKLQKKGAVHHWKIMRSVIPAVGWENY